MKLNIEFELTKEDIIFIILEKMNFPKTREKALKQIKEYVKHNGESSYKDEPDPDQADYFYERNKNYEEAEEVVNNLFPELK